jgi:hypothetical protein
MTKKIIVAVLSIIIGIGIGIGLKIASVAIIASDVRALPVDARKLELATLVTTVPLLDKVNSGVSSGRAKVDSALDTKVERNVVKNSKNRSLARVQEHLVDHETRLSLSTALSSDELRNLSKSDGWLLNDVLHNEFGSSVLVKQLNLTRVDLDHATLLG